MTAYHLAITEFETTRLLGHGLICPDARYASIRWRGQDRLERRYAEGQRWRLILNQLRDGSPKGRVANASAIGLLLLGDEARVSMRLQVITQPPVQDGEPMDVTAQLDDYLRAQLLP